MDLFDDFERTEQRTPISTDTKYGYLNLSARQAAEAVRTFLVDLAGRYPSAHREDLIKRIRSIDSSHDAAVFELVVHELLLRSGCEIVAVEPPIEGRATRPDFLVRDPSGAEFIVECVVASGISDAKAGADKLVQAALDAIAATPSPQHFLAVDINGSPTGAIKLKLLRRKLQAWIAGLPEGEAAKSSPAFRFEEHGLRLRLTVMVPRRHPPKPGDRSIGAISHGFRFSTPGDDLRGSLLKKATKYGELGRPYVIAINDAARSGERELMDALLGSPIAIFRPGEGGSAAYAGRASDGLWTDGRRPRKRGVSAVLWLNGAFSWRPWGRAIRLVRNPWATHPLPDVPLPFPARNPIDGEFALVAGEEGPGLFGLADDWPPE